MTQPPATSTGVRARLAELDLALPAAHPPAYSYDAVTVWGDIAFVSGQIPRRDGEISHRGVLGVSRRPEEAFEAAQVCALNALAQLDDAVGLDRVARVLKLMVFVASGPDVVEQPSAAEGASQVLLTAFGSAGRHARTALGVPRLPADALVEIDLVVGLHPDG
ncbi:RidA family protein [Nocardioides sp. BYT-33-1]|uniref:RidA family protein n=1 Tax=Nocardioides sp. BYT-33-1 TaxID=3416952 RepID=UPI003F537462